MKPLHPILTFLICLVMVNCSPKKTNEFTLTGKISGVDTGKIILNYVPGIKPVLDTAEIRNGKFSFSGQITEPLLSSLYIDRALNRVNLFIEPGNLTISLAKDDFKNFKMKGSKSQDEVVLLNNLTKPFEDKSNFFYSEWIKLSDSLKNSDDENIKADLNSQMDKIRHHMSKEDGKADSIRLKYIVDNPKSYVSAYYLQTMTVGKDDLGMDSIKSIFNRIDTAVQKGKYGKRISDDIRKRENTRIGAFAPDFKALDLNDQTITLSQFKNRSIVLLDFWASWCIPCRNNIPHLKTIYNKYQPMGFEIIAVSTDNSKRAWVSAVREENTSDWFNIHHGFNMFNQGELNEYDVYANYFYNSIPTRILIDFDGKIIGHWVGASPENIISLEKLLEEKLQKK